MSAIFGVIHLDGRPASPDSLRIMAGRMTTWGPDGIHTSCSGCVGLGHAHLIVTPESEHEAMPWTDRSTGMLFTAAARLDNRDELADLFGIPLSKQATLSDGQLVLKAYERWSEDAPAHLFGDWAFAVWDEKNRRMFIARDHLGNTGLFYFHRPPFFAFASTPRAILALPEVPVKMDEWRLARYLALFQGEESEWSRTYWEDVRSLLPAHSLILNSRALSLRKYWNVADAPAVRAASDNDYLEGFLAHFRRAVTVRLNSRRPVGTQLSSGLDSSSVSALAAESLAARGQTLPAFTSVPLYPAAHLAPGMLVDEWPLAHAVAEKHRNIEHIPIRAEGASPLRAVRDGFDMFGHPLHAVANLYWILAIHDEARRRGLGVLLSGQLGNGGVSWSGGSTRILFLFARGRWEEGFRALRSYRKYRSGSWSSTLRRQVLGPLLSPGRRAGPFISGDDSIHPDFARRVGLEKALKAARRKPANFLPRSPSWERRRIIEINAPGGFIHHHLGAFFGMEIRDPTADVRLIRYCFGLPEELPNRDGGERMVLRRSLAGILPEDVRVSAVRGKQAADLALRLLAHRDEMEDELQMLESREAVAARVDCRVLRRVWRDLGEKATPRASGRAASALLRGIMAGRFIMDSMES